MTKKNKKIIIIAITMATLLCAIIAFYPIVRPYIHLAAAKSSIARNDFDSASGHLQSIKNDYPEFAEKNNEVNFLLGFVYTNQGNYYRATNAFYKVTDDDELLSSLTQDDKMLMGYVFVETDNAFQALKTLNKIDEASLDNNILSTYYIYLAEAYFEKDELDKALAYTEKTLAFGDTLDSLNKAKAHLIRFMAYTQDETKHDLLEEEMQNIFSNNINGYDFFYLNNIINLLTTSPNFEESFVKNFTPQEGAPMFDASFYTLFSVFYGENGNYNEAEKYLKKAIETYPDHVPAYLAYAKIYTSQNNFKQALEYYEKAAEVDDSYFRTQNGIGWSLFELVASGELDETHLEEAEKHLNKALETNPEYSRPYNTIGVIYSMRGDSEQAIEYYKKALQFEEYAKPHKNLMLEYDKLGDTQSAQENYEKFIELGGDN